jgi:acetyl esterase/lipase
MASAEAERIRAALFGPESTQNHSIEQLDSISELRARQSKESERDQLPSGVSITPCTVAGVNAEWVSETHPNSLRTTILFLHGGGFIGGSCASYRNLAARIAIASHCRVVVPDYRLAPEHRFPASVEDAIAVYKELLRQGIAPSEVVIAGDSAGGAICAALLLAIRDGAGIMPAAAVLISPWMDLTFSGDSYRTRATLDPLDRLPFLRRAAELYLGGNDPASPLASPIFGDLHGLPKTLIQVGDHEVLLDDSRRFFEKAREEGVQVQIEVWPEMWHGWHMSAPALPEANEAIRRVGAFVQRVTST